MAAVVNSVNQYLNSLRDKRNVLALTKYFMNFLRDPTFKGFRGAGEIATNVAIGPNTLDVNTTGANNAAFGYQALDANTTGASNTAVGSGALGGNTTGANNTAVGKDALLGVTVGTGN